MYNFFHYKKTQTLRTFLKSILRRKSIEKFRAREADSQEMIKNKPAHILINALPKSASLFIARTIAATLNCEMMRVGTRGVNSSQADPEAICQFVDTYRAVAQDHIAPTQYNFKVLYCSGLTQFVVLFRDPRDALISWAHHLERNDIANKPWHKWLIVSSGIISEQYYDLSWDNKLNDLINNYYPIMIDWINGWVRLACEQDRFNIMIKTYEEFITDKPAFIESILKFYGFSLDQNQIVWPSDSRRMSNMINLDTHFRKGIVGSYHDELSKDQIQCINDKIDKDLFERFGWSF